MFRPKWPSSDVQVVVLQDSAAHCNAGFFLLLFLVMWVACGMYLLLNSEDNKIYSELFAEIEFMC
jgi:hypothetical protein